MAELDSCFQAACLTLTRNQIVMVINMFRKPFASDANFSKLRSCGDRFFREGDETNPAFMLLREDLAEALSFDLSGCGASDNARALFLECKKKWNQVSKGGVAQASRWWTVEDRAKQFDPSRPIVLLVLLIFGFDKGWWNSLEASPLMCHAKFLNTDVLAGLAAAEAAVEAGEVVVVEQEEAAEHVEEDHGEASLTHCTKAGAKKIVQKLRDHTPSLLKFCAACLAKPLFGRLYRLTTRIPDRVRDFFDSEMTSAKAGPWGSFDWQCSLALGSQVDMLKAHWHWITSESFADLCGFNNRRDDVDFSDTDCIVANSAWQWSLRLFGNFSRLDALHRFTPPYLFVPLGGSSNENRQTILSRCKACFESLEELEKVMPGQPPVQKYWRSMLWPQGCWPREILIQLACEEFTAVSDDVSEDSRLYGESFHTTLGCEQTGNLWRDTARHSKAKMMGPEAGWHRMFVKKIPLEEHGRPCVVTTEASSKLCASQEKLSYDTSGHENSLGSAKINTIHMSPAPWSNVSPWYFKQQAIKTLNCIDCRGNWVSMQLAFLCLLLTPGDLLFNNLGLPVGLVVFSSSDGLMMLSVERFRRYNKSCIDLVFGREKSPCYYCITDPTGFKVSQTQLLGPRQLGKQGIIDGKLVLVQTEDPECLVRRNLKNGLKNFNADGIRKLFDFFKVPYLKGAKPRTAEELLRAICLFKLGTDFDAMWPDIQKKHAAPEEEDDGPSVPDSFCETSVWQHLQEEAEENDPDLVAYQCYLKAEQEMKERKAKKAVIPEAIVVPSVPPPAEEEPETVVLPEDGCTIWNIDKYCPPGWKPSKGITREAYWQIRHTSGKPSASCRFDLSSIKSSNEAMAKCLREAWVKHIGNGTTKCPFKFVVP